MKYLILVLLLTLAKESSAQVSKNRISILIRLEKIMPLDGDFVRSEIAYCTGFFGILRGETRLRFASHCIPNLAENDSLEIFGITGLTGFRENMIEVKRDGNTYNEFEMELRGVKSYFRIPLDKLEFDGVMDHVSIRVGNKKLLRQSQVLRISTKLPKAGDVFTTIGFGHEFSSKHIEAPKHKACKMLGYTILSLKSQPSDSIFYVCEGRFREGDSGSPMMDKRARVIGIASAILKGAKRSYLLISPFRDHSIDELSNLSFLDTNKKESLENASLELVSQKLEGRSLLQ